MNKMFTSPVDASNYSAGLGMVHGAKLLGINYEENRYRFQLLDENGEPVSTSVFGVNVDMAREANARDDIADAIAATN